MCVEKLLYNTYYYIFDLLVALQLGSTSILNGDYEYFFPGSYIVAAGNFDFVYNRSLFSGVDVAFIDGPLSEPLFIRVRS